MDNHDIEASKEHAQDGRGIKHAAQRFAEYLFGLAPCVRALCALKEPELTDKSLDWLLTRILNDPDTADAAKQFQFLPGEPDMQPTLLAMTYLRVMRKNLRSRNLRNYWRFCTLYETEIGVSTQFAFWKSAMALENDWTTIESFLRIRLEVARLQISLRLAVLLPHGLKICNSAAFGLCQMAYLQAAV